MNKPGCSRRAFMGGVAAASLMTPAFAQGANSKLEIGIVGLGGRGRMITKMIRDHGGYHINSMCDYFPDVVDKAGDEFGVDAKHRFSGLNGYRGVVDSGIDAIFLETPPYCFPDHVEAAVAAGLHVYMAKPVACDAPGTLRVLEAAKRAKAAGKVFLIDFQMRTDPLIIEGIKRLQRGDIGPLGMLCSQYTDEGFDDPPLTDNIESRLQHLIWVNDIAIGGGYHVNAGIHAVDAALWIAGRMPVSATGSSRIARKNPHGDTHDTLSITYEFPDGLLLNHIGEHLRNRYEWHCDALAFCLNGHLETSYNGRVRMLGNNAGWAGGKTEGLYERGAEVNIAAFHDCVQKGDCQNPTVEPSINSTLATILGRDACERKTRLTWEQMLAENRVVQPDLSGLKT
ncbi:MAG TPA: Gfo/Idh/MocA family oxidoreductase [Candidatus Bathyarchaeia archaeon]|nr:Gfo/Idh/MocA family oxidoreductase [Candidatus Bathyarchaeia archaeon]